jgi:hypothetical protein
LKSDVAKDLPNKHDNANSRIKKVMPAIQLDRYKQEIEMANDSDLEGVEKRNQKLKSLWPPRKKDWQLLDDCHFKRNC